MSKLLRQQALIHTIIDPWRLAARLGLMGVPSPIMLAALILAAMMPVTLQADYLKNSDFKEGSQLWHGDGQLAFLKPDGTEGAEGDPGAIPVLRLGLSKGHTHAIFQDYQTPDHPKTQHIRVEVFASLDFKRSKFAGDYTSELNWKAGTTVFVGNDIVPNVDFWMGDTCYYVTKLANLKPGEWVTVDLTFDTTPGNDAHSVCFMVPPGEGAIYIKNPSATK